MEMKLLHNNFSFIFFLFLSFRGGWNLTACSKWPCIIIGPRSFIRHRHEFRSWLIILWESYKRRHSLGMNPVSSMPQTGQTMVIYYFPGAEQHFPTWRKYGKMEEVLPWALWGLNFKFYSIPMTSSEMYSRPVPFFGKRLVWTVPNAMPQGCN